MRNAQKKHHHPVHPEPPYPRMKACAFIYAPAIMEEYQRLEAELSAGHPIEDPETRAEHAAIKARIDSGESLPEAVFKYHMTKLDQLDVHLRTQGMN